MTDNGTGKNLDIDIDIDVNVIIDALIASPVFLNRLRNVLLKDVRAKGDLYGPRFSKPPVANASLIQPVAPNRLQ